MRLTSLSALVRSLRRHPVYTGINVVGLTVALAACLLIGLYTAEELRYDAFHENADRIQVLAIESDFFGRTSSTSYPMGETLRDQSPRVEEVARINDRRSHPLMRPGEKATPPMKVLYTEASFARVFSFPVVRGDLEQALTEPGSIALTASTAERLFGDGDALGQPVLFADEDDAGPRTVRAIVADAPEASTIQFDALRPLSDYEYTQEDSWGALMYRTFVLLERPEPSDTFLAHATAILEEAAPDKNWAYAAVDFSSFYLSDLYQASGFRGQQQYLYIFGIAALLVLLRRASTTSTWRPCRGSDAPGKSPSTRRWGPVEAPWPGASWASPCFLQSARRCWPWPWRRFSSPPSTKSCRRSSRSAITACGSRAPRSGLASSWASRPAPTRASP